MISWKPMASGWLARPLSFDGSARGLLMVTVIVGLAGCQPPKPTAEVKEVKVGEAAKQTAIDAKDALFARLSGRLTEVISQDGSAAAIEVCSREAATIAAEVAKQHGVSIGRTSFQLRNPKNTAPAWAKTFIKQRVSEPQFVPLPHGATGALLPIRLKGKCLACHGPADEIAADVRANLKKLYPKDQATGFKEGDLRGWFWVEAPAVESEGDNIDTPEDHAVHAAEHGFGRGKEPRFGRGMGKGMGRGFGRGKGGRGPGPGMRGDMTTLHTMFDNRDKIQRTVKLQPQGAEALTESDDPKVAALLQEHVPAMESRVHENEPLPPMTFHPVFVELIKHANDYSLDYEDTEKGIKVIYKAKDPFVITLVQEHAKLVSRFIQNGMEEIHKPYKLPKVGDTTIKEPTTRGEAPAPDNNATTAPKVDR